MAAENFIFLSYSHRNIDRLGPVISHLKSLRYNLWYDHNVEGGSEWSDNTAHHIEDCRCFIAFISSYYINSANCKDELSYARDLEKAQLLVFLEDVKLPSGMAMRMNRIQYIHYYPNESFEELLNRLNCFSGFSECRDDEIPPDSPPNPVSSQVPMDILRREKKESVFHFSPGRFPAFRITAATAGMAGILCIGVIAIIHFNTKMIDPFSEKIFDVSPGQGIYVEYKGYYPDGYLTVVNTYEDGNPYSEISFSLSAIDVNPGDRIIITAAAEKSGISLTRKTLEYTVGNLPHYLDSPEELTSDQLKKLGNQVLDYVESNTGDCSILDGEHIYETSNGTTTYLSINANSYLYLIPGEDSRLFIIIDKSLDTDYYEDGLFIGHKEFNTLIAACEIHTLVVDENGEVSFLYSDPNHMDISDYYINDAVMNNLYFNEIREDLSGDGYVFYSMMSND